MIAMDADDVTPLDSQAARALEAIDVLRFPADASQEACQQAQEVLNDLQMHPRGADIARRVVQRSACPLVQHGALHLMIASVSSGLCRMPAEDLEHAKDWLFKFLCEQTTSGSASASSCGQEDAPKNQSRRHLVTKSAEAIAAIARQTWPCKWMELTDRLLALLDDGDALRAAAALSVFVQILDIPEDGTVRKEVAAEIQRLLVQPAGSPQLARRMIAVCRQHSADEQLLRLALKLVGAMSRVTPFKILLKNQFDTICANGVKLPASRVTALSTLHDWVEQLRSVDKGSLAARDVRRLADQVVQLAAECIFAKDSLESYIWHCHVAELVNDFCSAGLLAKCLDPTEGAERGAAAAADKIRRRFMDVLTRTLLRYPSTHIQREALNALMALVSLSPATARMVDLSVLVPLFWILLLRWDPAASTSADTLILATLCKNLAHSTPATASEWMSWMHTTENFSATGGMLHGTTEYRSDLKSKVNAILLEACRREQGRGLGAYGVLCRTAGALVNAVVQLQIQLGQDTHGQYDAALFMVEAAGCSLLKEAQMSGCTKDLDTVLASSLEFLREAASDAALGIHETRCFELMGRWAPFLCHFKPDIRSGVVDKILKSVEKSLDAGQTAASTEHRRRAFQLQRSALDALLLVGKAGALSRGELEVVYAAANRMSSRLGPAAQGKIACALLAAGATCASTAEDQLAVTQMMQTVIETATARWLEVLTDLTDFSRLLSHLTACVAEVERCGSDGDQCVHVHGLTGKLSEARSLLATFIAIVLETTSAPRVAVLRNWVPGVFALSASLASLSSASGGHPVQATSPPSDAALLQRTLVLVGLPSDLSREDSGGNALAADAIEQCTLKRLHPLRELLRDLRAETSKAIKASMSCDSSWEVPEAVTGLAALGEGLYMQRPHHADLILKEVFQTLFGQGIAGERSRWPSKQQRELCEKCIPALCRGGTALILAWWDRLPTRTLAVRCWSGVPPGYEPAFTSAVVSFSRRFTRILSALTGSRTPEAGLPHDFATRRQRVMEDGRDVEQCAAGIAGDKDGDVAKGGQKRGQKRSLAEAESKGDGGTGPMPCSAAAMVLTTPELRTAVREALVKLLSIPDAEVMQEALLGISTWSAQVWNQASCMEDQNDPSSLPNIRHKAMEALKPFAFGILDPLLQLARMPPQLTEPADSSAGAACLQCLSGATQQGWQAFAHKKTTGKLCLPLLLVEVARVISSVLTVLVKCLKMQCKKIKVSLALDAVYLCPPLHDGMRTLERELPGVEEALVRSTIAPFIREEKPEMRRDAVKAVLSKAVVTTPA